MVTHVLDGGTLLYCLSIDDCKKLEHLVERGHNIPCIYNPKRKNWWVTNDVFVKYEFKGCDTEPVVLWDKSNGYDCKYKDKIPLKDLLDGRTIEQYDIDNPNTLYHPK